MRNLDDALKRAESLRDFRATNSERFERNQDFLDIVLLADEVTRLKQGLWDCATITGDDQNGDKIPIHMTFPDIVDYAKREVQRLRDECDEADEVITRHAQQCQRSWQLLATKVDDHDESW